MGKDKLRKFAENKVLDNVLEPSYKEVVEGATGLKGAWNKVFGNDHPITLELACGKGEYTVGLARMHPERNFIGVDIKGARQWRGAKTAKEEGLDNVRFLRTHIELIDQIFAEGEVAEIWITFPDPQLKDRREKKRLTHANFLERYRRIVQPDATLNLKCDSQELYAYSLEVLQAEGITPEIAHNDIYSQWMNDQPIWVAEAMAIKTHYEKMWLEKGKTICLLRFKIHK